MKVLRRTACMLIAAASFLSLPAHSASFSTDQSDLYYIPTESGWGMQLVQRGGTIFSTLFVYGPSTAPTWYVATMNPTGGAFQWSGDLYATTGPWFGTVPFNPANVTVTKVGTMTWIAQSTNTGNVSYTVNGVAVSKNVVRQTLVNENYSGHFAGAIHETDISCGGFNGTSDSAGILNVVQNGSAVTITASVPNGSCAYAGTRLSTGRWAISSARSRALSEQAAHSTPLSFR